MLVIFGFLSMALFGASYYVVPRLTGREFLQADASWHFWLSAWGVGTMFLSLCLWRRHQGFALYDPGVEFISSVTLAAPFRAMYALGTLVFLGSCLALQRLSRGICSGIFFLRDASPLILNHRKL